MVVQTTSAPTQSYSRTNERLTAVVSTRSSRIDILIQDEYEEDSLDDGIMSTEEVEAEIAAYEAMYGFDSEEMLRRDRLNLLPDAYEIQAWKMLLHALE